MLSDGFVDLGHQEPSFSKGGDDLSVVVDVVLGKRAAFPVLEPLLCRAVAADSERPAFQLDALKILFAVDPYAPRQTAGWGRITHLVHLVSAAVGECRLSIRALSFHQVKADEAGTEANQINEQ